MLTHYNIEDFSYSIHKPIAYIDFIRDRLLNTDDDGGVHLKENEVQALGWMLSDAGITIDQINDALYGNDTKYEPATATIEKHCDGSNKPIQYAAHQIKHVSQELHSLESALVSVSDQIDSINGDITTHGLAQLVSLIADKLHELQSCLLDSLSPPIQVEQP